MALPSDGPAFYLGSNELEPPRHMRVHTYCVVPWGVYCGYDFQLGDQLLTRIEGELRYFFQCH